MASFVLALVIVQAVAQASCAPNSTAIYEQLNAVQIKVTLALTQFIASFLALFFTLLLLKVVDLSHPVFALIFQETVVMFTFVMVTYIGFFVYLTEDFQLWCQAYQEVYAGLTLFHQVTWLSVTFLR